MIINAVKNSSGKIIIINCFFEHYIDVKIVPWHMLIPDTLAQKKNPIIAALENIYLTTWTCVYLW